MTTAASAALGRAIGSQVDAANLKPASTLTADDGVYYNATLNTYVIYKAGASLNGYDFGNAAVIVQTNNVSFQNCTFQASANGGNIKQEAAYSGLVVDQCSFDGLKLNTSKYGDFVAAYGKDATVENSSFVNAPSDSIYIENGTVAGNYIAGGGYKTGAHADAIWVGKRPDRSSSPATTSTGGTPSDAATATNNAIRITAENGSVNDVTITNNTLYGGAYTIDVNAGATETHSSSQIGTITNVKITDNVIAYGQYGALDPANRPGDLVYSGNVNTTGTATDTQTYVQYDQAGHKTASITTNADGSTTTDKYNSSGALTQSSTLHADGSRDVHDYGVTGQNYVSDHRVYNAAGTLTQFVAISSDGSKVVSDYVVSGEAYASDQLSFNAAGVLVSAVYYNNDGSTTTDKYGSTGALTQHTLLHADGSRDIYDYGVTGQNYVSDHRVYDTAGTLTQFVAIGSDGSKVVSDYAVSGEAYASDQFQLNAGGVLVSAVYYNNDGSTTTDKFGSTGALTQHTTLNADGSRDVYDYGVTGQNYVSDHRVYNAAGTLTQFVVVGADGSKVVSDYAVSGEATPPTS